MTSEEKQKINVWIPGSLWKQIGSLGYESPTKATIAAFEALVLQEASGSNQEVLGSAQEEFRKLQEEVRKYQEENRKLQEEIGRAPDPVTFAQLQARYEGLQMIIEEKDRRIEALNNDLRKADIDKEDLKATYNNYFLQVQTLINQKAIGTGSTQGEKPIKEKKESRPAQKEENTIIEVQEKPDIETEKKGSLEITCLNCGKVFTAARSTRMYCSGACKEAYRRKMKKEDMV